LLTLDYVLDTKISKEHNTIAGILTGRHKQKRQKVVHLSPIVFAELRAGLGKVKTKALKVLLDSGASTSLVQASAVKKLRHKKTRSETWTTAAGTFQTTHTTDVEFKLPEFSSSRIIKANFHIMENHIKYDMILGRDILSDLGIDLLFSNQLIQWPDINMELPMRSSDVTYEEAFLIGDGQAIDDATARIQQILDAKYEPADLDQVVAECVHLTDEEQTKLKNVLVQYRTLFDGSLGHWKDKLYDIKLKEGAQPYHARAYPIPRVHETTLRMEVDRLCQLGVLKRVNRSEWGAPTFIIPKKDGTVRFISDFRQLNQRIKRQPHPIPKIQDLLLKLEGFTYATSLDLNMGYYHIELTPNSKRLCTIVLPWGKYEYQRLPMGLCNSPDIFQEKMSVLMEGLEFVRTYIDDVLIHTKGSLTDHLSKLHVVLRRIKHAGLKINAKKSFFARPELEYLGYWITRSGIQPTTKKVQAIQAIAQPTNKRKLRKLKSDNENLMIATIKSLTDRTTNPAAAA